MATVGIVGGLGPESTIDYYRRILDAWARVEPSTAPSIVIDSLDVRRGLYLAEEDHAARVHRLGHAAGDVVDRWGDHASPPPDSVSTEGPTPRHSLNFLTTSVSFCPPNPNEFDRHTSTPRARSSRALLGT